MNFVRRFASSSTSSSTKPVVELFYDLISPYSYVQFELLARRRPEWVNSCTIRYTPVFIPTVFNNADNQAPGFNPLKAKYIRKDMSRLAEYHEIPFRFPKDFMQFAVGMGSLKVQHYLTAIEPQLSAEEYERLIGSLFRNYFHPTKSQDISSNDVIRSLTKEAGINNQEVIEKALKDAENNEEVKNKLQTNSEKVTEFGGFGLPVTVVHLASGPEMIFGSDRMHIIGRLIGKRFE